MNLSADSITRCTIRNSILSYCVLYECALENCVLNNCQVHFTVGGDIDDSTFTNCTLTTTSRAGTVYVDGERLFNCTLKGNFAEDRGQSSLAGTAKHPENVQIAPYEIHNNVVLKESVVDCLRRYIWRFRMRRAKKRIHHPAVGIHSPPTSPETDTELTELALACFQKKKALVWTAKSAGKRPMELSDLYSEEEQLEMPLRRQDWSVSRGVERNSPPKRRRLDVSWARYDG
jgi:hypothetical protein